jgi:tetratricopeptide (TPR) repeat protein
MRTATFLLIGLGTLANSGCVIVTSYAKLEPQLEQWEQQREFGRSLDALSQIDPQDPDYNKAAEVRKQIEKRASEYEQQVRKETYQKQEKGDWAGALDQYDEALAKHPKSAVIKDGLAKLHQQQRQQLELLEQQRLIQHGEWLRDVLPVYREITTVDPRSLEAKQRLQRVVDEAKGIANELALIGNKALADNDLKTAEATLPLAFKLSNDPVIEESLNSLRAEQKQQSAKQREARRKRERQVRAARQKKEEAISTLEKEYQRAFGKQDFNTARKRLREIEKVDRRYSKLAEMKRTLQQAIDNKVAKLFDAGVSAYSRGQFEQAARNWRNALELDPKHQQAQESLERAEKVLENIQRLKEKQGE